VFMAGGQLGKTECGNNWIGYVIHHAPGPMMAVSPTVEMAKRNSKQRIDPLIEESPVLAELISPARSRDSGNTILAKESMTGERILPLVIDPGEWIDIDSPDDWLHAESLLESGKITLDDLGFEAAVVWLIDRNLKERGINCFMNLQELEEDKLRPELQITLFRIIQELTTNIARHAQAQNVLIHAKNDDKLFSMTIEDDGTGFDTETVFENTLTGRGLGILGMKERATQVNGTLRICSHPNQGTMVLCTVPISPEV